jgi:hypothetical protein
MSCFSPLVNDVGASLMNEPLLLSGWVAILKEIRSSVSFSSFLVLDEISDHL